jgi:hypothetical protein
VLLTPRLPPAVACPHPPPHCPCPRSATAPGWRAPRRANQGVVCGGPSAASFAAGRPGRDVARSAASSAAAPPRSRPRGAREASFL